MNQKRTPARPGFFVPGSTTHQNVMLQLLM